MSIKPLIAEKSQICRALFDQACREWKDATETPDETVSSQDMQSQQGQYHLWTKNISAEQDGRLPSSLEYRIREDPTAQDNINRALMYLSDDLESSEYCIY